MPEFEKISLGEKLAFVALISVIFALYAVLPSSGVTIFASPDETAVAITAKQISERGVAFISEPLVSDFPWLHPRSWVSQGELIVPVGFLGWPMILSVFMFVGGVAILPWIASALLASLIWPLSRLLREQYGRKAAWWGCAIAGTVPPMVVYGNRGLFPNPAVLALGVWMIWFFRRFFSCTWWGDVLLGFGAVLVLAIRPPEALWLIPWWLWAAYDNRKFQRQDLWVIVGCLLATVPLFILMFRTYQPWWAVGYWVREAVPLASAVLSAPDRVSVDWWPFGFHPRHVWYNVRFFLFGLLLPWSLVTVVGMGAWLWKQIKNNKVEFKLASFLKENAPVLLAFWTVGVLVLFYGQGLYADHVRKGAVTVGNSFLRYLLPLAPLLGWAVAFLWSSFKLRFFWQRALRLAAGSGLIVFGAYYAFVGDDEGIWRTRQELFRYQEIRADVQQWLKPTDIILSERSDKIFFPHYRSVSPLPPAPEVVRLLRGQPQVRLVWFARPLSQADKDLWYAQGVQFSFLKNYGREQLVELRLRSD